MTEVRKKENAYFIAANGYTGFRSQYDVFFRSALYTRVYIIKGGPGTGKNRMMQEIAQKVEEQGGQVDYIYCSSDPSSLDGVVLKNKDKRIAVLDGTAPHTRCTELPGVADEIVNLGAFWNEGCLKEQRDEIIRLCQEKSAEYQVAYRYLSLAGAVDKLLTEMLFSCIDHEKMKKSVSRSLRSLTRTRSPSERLRYYDACSMRGKLCFSSLPTATEVICVDDYLYSGRFYLTVSYLLQETSLTPFDLFDGFAQWLYDTNKKVTHVSLDEYTAYVLDYFSALDNVDKDRLWDTLVCDALSSRQLNRLPSCLFVKDPRVAKITRLLKQTKNAHIKRGIWVLRAQKDRIAVVEYTNRDPVTGRYSVDFMPLSQFDI
jgi:hypothetical protein